MKKIALLSLILGMAFHAQNQAQAATFCSQKVQAAVSQQGQCVQYANPCLVPSDWKKVPSCDLIEDATKSPSLEDRLRARFSGKNVAVTPDEAIETAEKSRNFSRLGKGRFTRERGFGTERLATQKSTTQKRDSVRASTTRNYDSPYRLRSLKAGKNAEDGENPVTERSTTSTPIRSRAFGGHREGYLENKAKWKVQKEDHYRERSYGQNPYNLKTQYLRNQEAAQTHKVIDAEARQYSRSRRWRPGRLDGNLSGSDLLKD